MGELIVSSQRELALPTLDDIAPQRRLQIMLPPGICRTKKRHRNDLGLVHAQFLVGALWIHGPLSHSWIQLDRVELHALGLTDQEIDAALSRSVEQGWLERATVPEPDLCLRVTEAIHVPPSSGPQLPLGTPGPCELAVDRLAVHASTIRPYFARRLVRTYPRGLYRGHVMLAWHMLALAGSHADMWRVDYRVVAKYCAMERSTVRNAMYSLAEFLGLAVQYEYGHALVHHPLKRLGMRHELLDRTAAVEVQWSGGLVEGVRPATGDQEPYPSPPGHLVATSTGDQEPYPSPPGHLVARTGDGAQGSVASLRQEEEEEVKKKLLLLGNRIYDQIGDPDLYQWLAFQVADLQLQGKISEQQVADLVSRAAKGMAGNEIKSFLQKQFGDRPVDFAAFRRRMGEQWDPEWSKGRPVKSLRNPLPRRKPK